VAQAEDKSWYLSNRHRQVADPTSVDSGRKKLGFEVRRYLDDKSGCKKTLSAHQHALLEFQEWATARKNGRDIAYVDEIDKRLLRRFFEFLVDGDEEEDGPANCPFTAAHKVMKVNAFCRSVYDLEPGKGPVTKKEYKRCAVWPLYCTRTGESHHRSGIDRGIRQGERGAGNRGR
jgi:hypothetical protein